VVNCDPPQAADLRHRAMELVAAEGKTAQNTVIDALVNRAVHSSAGSGGDVNTLIQETMKLITYVGERETIDRADADLLITQESEENIFALLDAIGNRDVRQAMALTEVVLEASDRADAVAARTFVMMQRHLRLLCLTKFLCERKSLGRGALPKDVKDCLSGEMAGFAATQAYRLSRMVKQAALLTWADLKRSMARVLASDLSMKGIAAAKSLHAIAPNTSDDAASNLRLLVVSLCTGD
jgi:DNA polymerase III delta subunit